MASGLLTQIDPGGPSSFHVVLAVAVLVFVGWAAYRAYRDPRLDRPWNIVVAVGVLVLPPVLALAYWVWSGANRSPVTSEVMDPQDQASE